MKCLNWIVGYVVLKLRLSNFVCLLIHITQPPDASCYSSLERAYSEVVESKQDAHGRIRGSVHGGRELEKWAPGYLRDRETEVKWGSSVPPKTIWTKFCRLRYLKGIPADVDLSTIRLRTFCLN